MKFLNGFRKIQSDWTIAPISSSDVGRVKNAEVSIIADISPAPFTPRLANLEVGIKNEGNMPVNDLYVMATLTNGYSLTNPSEVFGTSWRMERLKQLNRGQSINFKLALRSNSNAVSGALKIYLSATENIEDPEAIKLNLALNPVIFN